MIFAVVIDAVAVNAAADVAMCAANFSAIMIASRWFLIRHCRSSLSESMI